MMRKGLILAFLVCGSITFALVAAAQQQTVVSSASAAPATSAVAAAAPSISTKSVSASSSTATAKNSTINTEPSMRIEGEKRFHANCSRCHMAPTKLPPRAAATIIRHMRVRATITDEDMRYILAYLAQ